MIRRFVENHYKLVQEDKKVLLIKCMQILHREKQALEKELNLQNGVCKNSQFLISCPGRLYRESEKWLKTGVENVFDRHLLPSTRLVASSGSTPTSTPRDASRVGGLVATLSMEPKYFFSNVSKRNI